MAFILPVVKRIDKGYGERQSMPTTELEDNRKHDILPRGSGWSSDIRFLGVDISRQIRRN